MKNKQRGIFMVELSLVLLVFSLLFVFAMDIIIKLSHQGKLDRMSHSIVSILAERRQLFNGNDILCSTEESGCDQAVDQMYLMAKNSLARMFSNFDATKMTMVIEQLQFEKNEPSHYYAKWLEAKSTDCKFLALRKLESLSPETSYSRRASLFQVTICYGSDDLTTNILGNGFTTLSSSSVALARNG